MKFTAIAATASTAFALTAGVAIANEHEGDMEAKAGEMGAMHMQDRDQVALLQAFLAIDDQGDGDYLITETEWVEWQNWGDVEPPAFDTLDANDSGAISFMEYHNAYIGGETDLPRMS